MIKIKCRKATQVLRFGLDTQVAAELLKDASFDAEGLVAERTAVRVERVLAAADFRKLPAVTRGGTA